MERYDTEHGEDHTVEMEYDVSDDKSQAAETEATISSINSEITEEKAVESCVEYGIEVTPSWYLCLMVGFQHYIAIVGGVITSVLVIAQPLCLEDPHTLAADDVAKTELMATVMFMSGIITIMQCTIGSRLPIVQGPASGLIPPIITLLTSMGECPTILSKETNMTTLTSSDSHMNGSVVLAGTSQHKDIWMARMRMLQGAIMVASVTQILIGCSGVLGVLLRYIGPLVITPMLMMVGLGLFRIAADNAGTQWGISILTIVLMCMFSEYLKDIKLPTFGFDRTTKKCFKRGETPVFRLFAVVLAMLGGYLVCATFTYTNTFPNDPEHHLYKSRTDTRMDIIHQAKWFRIPYPAQWGIPTVSLAGVMGMMAAIFCTIIQSIGEYHACARVSGASPPPIPAINRGITIQGVGSLLIGLVGSGTGTGSYATNIAVIGITKVASRRVVQTGGLVMIFLGMFPKFAAIFVTIPAPVLGGMYTVIFGIIVSVGMSNLQYINLNSSRNIFILGVSIMMGLTVPDWMDRNRQSIDTGSSIADDLIVVLMGTNMFISGAVAFILDNTIQGTREERGLAVWDKERNNSSDEPEKDTCYNMPFGNDIITRSKWMSYVPLCPTFMRHKKDDAKVGNINHAASLETVESQDSVQKL